MKLLVVYCSESGNTEQVARAVAQATGAELKRLQDVAPAATTAYDLIFLGTPVQGSRPAPAVRRFLAELPAGEGRRAAAFCTKHLWGGWGTLRLVRQYLEVKGYRYLGGFSCLGWSRLIANFGPRIFNRGRPSPEDLARAAAFARQVQAQAQSLK